MISEHPDSGAAKDPRKEFLDTYSGLIHDLARKAGLSEAAAKEVVQEIAVIVLKKNTEFAYEPKKGSFKGWLLHTANWHIADKLRKKRLGHRPFAEGGA